MAVHGAVAAFDPSKEDFSSYAERLDHYFIANDVKDEAKQRSILLSVCGPATYKLIRSLVDGDGLTTKTHTE